MGARNCKNRIVKCLMPFCFQEILWTCRVCQSIYSIRQGLFFDMIGLQAERTEVTEVHVDGIPGHLGNPAEDHLCWRLRLLPKSNVARQWGLTAWQLSIPLRQLCLTSQCQTNQRLLCTWISFKGLLQMQWFQLQVVPDWFVFKMHSEKDRGNGQGKIPYFCFLFFCEALRPILFLLSSWNRYSFSVALQWKKMISSMNWPPIQNLIALGLCFCGWSSR